MTLLILFSISLTISTLHSHHHFQWDHPQEFADTGHCLTEDVTVCPICGYLLKTDLPSASEDGSVFSASGMLTIEADFFLSSADGIVIKGRSPPVLC